MTYWYGGCAGSTDWHFTQKRSFLVGVNRSLRFEQHTFDTITG